MGALSFGCGQDKDIRKEATQQAIEAATPEMLPGSAAEGKVVSLDSTRIVLHNNRVITLPGSPDTAVIFLARYAETLEGKTALSEPGMARAGWLATQLQGANLLQVFCSKDNSSLQTANFVARSAEVEFNYLNTPDSYEIAAVLVNNYRGKRVAMVATPAIISGVLQQLTGRPKLKTPDSEFDNLYLIFASKTGEAVLHHLQF